MKPKDGKPYFWVTWLTPLLGGDAHCELAAWIRSRYWYEKRADENENRLSQWRADHAEMVRRRVDTLRERGWTVTVEAQNKFSYEGRVAVVGACPDIVAVRGEDALIVDCKTGRPREKDFWQVVIYCLLAPSFRPDLKTLRLSGEVEYAASARAVSPFDVEQSRERVRRLIETLATASGATAAPSVEECRFCDIAECEFREDGVTGATVRGEEF